MTYWRYKADGRESFQLTPAQILARNKIESAIQSGSILLEEASCNLCGQNNPLLLSGKDAYGLSVNTVLCKSCGLTYVSPRLSKASLELFYSEYFRALDRVLQDIDSYFEMEEKKGSAILELLRRLDILHGLHGKVIVDVGCGAGGVLNSFFIAGFKVVGCDFIAEHLEYGIEKYDLDLLQGNVDAVLDKLGGNAENVGLVIYEQVFEHLVDPMAELARLADVLQVGTYLYIGVPGLRNIPSHYGSDFIRYLQLPHLYNFDLEHLTDMLSMSGFTLVYGDETVRAIFRKTAIKGDHRSKGVKSTISYLLLIECNYLFLAAKRFIVGLPNFCRSMGIKWLSNPKQEAGLGSKILSILKKIDRVIFKHRK